MGYKPLNFCWHPLKIVIERVYFLLAPLKEKIRTLLFKNPSSLVGGVEGGGGELGLGLGLGLVKNMLYLIKQVERRLMLIWTC